jgi:hypothetical protein
MAERVEGTNKLTIEQVAENNVGFEEVELAGAGILEHFKEESGQKAYKHYCFLEPVFTLFPRPGDHEDQD